MLSQINIALTTIALFSTAFILFFEARGFRLTFDLLTRGIIVIAATYLYLHLAGLPSLKALFAIGQESMLFLTLVLVAVPEELIKSIAGLKSSASPLAAALIAGFAFSYVETPAYALTIQGSWFPVLAGRMVTALPAHIFFSYALFSSKKYVGFFPALALSTLIHAAYNYLLSGQYAYVAGIITVAASFLFLFFVRASRPINQGTVSTPLPA